MSKNYNGNFIRGLSVFKLISASENHTVILICNWLEPVRECQLC